MYLLHLTNVLGSLFEALLCCVGQHESWLTQCLLHILQFTVYTSCDDTPGDDNKENVRKKLLTELYSIITPYPPESVMNSRKREYGLHSRPKLKLNRRKMKRNINKSQKRLGDQTRPKYKYISHNKEGGFMIRGKYRFHRLWITHDSQPLLCLMRQSKREQGGGLKQFHLHLRYLSQFHLHPKCRPHPYCCLSTSSVHHVWMQPWYLVPYSYVVVYD